MTKVVIFSVEHYDQSRNTQLYGWNKEKKSHGGYKCICE